MTAPVTGWPGRQPDADGPRGLRALRTRGFLGLLLVVLGIPAGVIGCVIVQQRDQEYTHVLAREHGLEVVGDPVIGGEDGTITFEVTVRGSRLSATRLCDDLVDGWEDSEGHRIYGEATVTFLPSPGASPETVTCHAGRRPIPSLPRPSG